MTDKQLIAELKDYIKENNPRKYYFDVTQEYHCNELCYLKNDDTHIGSFTCSECENCIDINNDENSIICLKIKKATNT